MSFPSIAGHRALLELLARASARGTLPPSLIFSGPEGVGKRTTALALAQTLNCGRPVEWGRPVVAQAFRPAPAGVDAALKGCTTHEGITACGDCGACRRIARGIHADVLVIEPGDSGNIKVDQVRDAIERAAYRPFEGRRRVVIIDEADALVPEAQNALLKTLEEPPSASVFVLISGRPDLLLPTVRSRCQRLRFGPLSAADVARVLIRDRGLSADAAHAAAAASGGSVGRALDAVDGAGDVVQARHAAARALQGAAPSNDPRRRLDAARALAGGTSDRDELARRLRAMASLLRDLGLLLSRADDRALANGDLKPQLHALLRSFDGERALRAFSAVDRALAGLERNASPKIVADWVALQL
jgi:DNA polymerase III subunit delta'